MYEFANQTPELIETGECSMRSKAFAWWIHSTRIYYIILGGIIGISMLAPHNKCYYDFKLFIPVGIRIFNSMKKTSWIQFNFEFWGRARIESWTWSSILISLRKKIMRFATCLNNNIAIAFQVRIICSWHSNAKFLIVFKTNLLKDKCVPCVWRNSTNKHNICIPSARLLCSTRNFHPSWDNRRNHDVA